MRNWLAHKIANFALNRIATPWYRDMIGGSILYGLKAAARDADASPRLSVDSDHDLPGHRSQAEAPISGQSPFGVSGEEET